MSSRWLRLAVGLVWTTSIGCQERRLPFVPDAGDSGGSVDSGSAVEPGFRGELTGRLVAPDEARGGSFGQAVAVSGDTLVVGAPLDANGGTGSGAVAVFVLRDGAWRLQAFLRASDAAPNDNFGQAVAISGDVLVAGAFLRSEGALFAGAAYVFERSGETWSEIACLTASNPGINDRFGASVAISGNTIAIGADGESSDAIGVNGEQNSEAASTSGAVYVFDRRGGQWQQTAYLKASNTDAFDLLGWSVAIDGDTLVAGAFAEGSDATGVDGDSTNNRAMGSGAAYVFERDAAGWAQTAYLKASNAEAQDGFSNSVSIARDTIVVGAYGEDSAATGVDGNGHDNGADRSGAAYVFQRSDRGWTPAAYLKASNTGGGDAFGASVSVSGGRIVVGAFGEASAASGVDGDALDNSVSERGAAYVFQRVDDAWAQRAYLKPEYVGNAAARFGYNVAASGEWVAVGASGEPRSIDASAGAAYVFR